MFQFTIRELVLVTVIVAMGLGWWLDRTHLDSDCQRFAFLAELALEKMALLQEAVESRTIVR